MNPTRLLRSGTAAALVLLLLTAPLAGQDQRRKGERAALTFFALAATSALLIGTDESVQRNVKNYADDHPWTHDVASIFSPMGEAGAWAAAGLFVGAGFLLKDRRARETGYLAASAMAQTFLVNHLVKGLTGRQRPFFADGLDHWSGPAGFFKRYSKANDGRYDSFPSGHAATAFSLATVAAHQYRRSGWVPIAAYGLAAVISLSRVALDKHWMSDVFVGAVVGHLVAQLVLRHYEKKRRFVPFIGCSGTSVALGFNYAFNEVGQ